MTLLIAIYILLIALFLVMSSLVFRHTVKFGYLSPRFRLVMGIFGTLAVGIITLSVYLLFVLSQVSESGVSPVQPTHSNSNGLNF